jgi:hypothetical protein
LQFKIDGDESHRDLPDLFAPGKDHSVDQEGALSVLRKDGKGQKVAVSISEIWLGEKRKIVGIIRDESA